MGEGISRCGPGTWSHCVLRDPRGYRACGATWQTTFTYIGHLRFPITTWNLEPSVSADSPTQVGRWVPRIPGDFKSTLPLASLAGSNPSVSPRELRAPSRSPDGSDPSPEGQLGGGIVTPQKLVHAFFFFFLESPLLAFLPASNFKRPKFL